MDQKRSLSWMACFAVCTILAGCGVKQYALPQANEPAAIVKLKTSINQEKARSLPPGNGFSSTIGILVNLKEKESWFQVMTKQDASIFASTAPTEMEVHSFRIHPDRPAILSAHVGVNWKTQGVETVWETRREPKQVTETVSQYDYTTKRTKQVQQTKTVYEDKRYQVTKNVIRNHGVGCGASVVFTPRKDEIYLLDYTNPSIDSGCTMSIYRQVALADGKFKLEPVEQQVIADKPEVKKAEEPEAVKPEELKKTDGK